VRAGTHIRLSTEYAPGEAISNLGRSYVDLILRNYHEDRITLMNASQYLGVKTEKVHAVEDLIVR